MDCAKWFSENLALNGGGEESHRPVLTPVLGGDLIPVFAACRTPKTVPSGSKAKVCGGMVPAADWADWGWPLENRLTTVEQLERFMTLTEEEKAGCAFANQKLALAITPPSFQPDRPR
jgi:hypothetical protein